MKSAFMKWREARRGEGQRGIALVLVLGALVLLTVLVIAFLISVQTEVRASASYRASVDARQLAEIPLEMIKTQLALVTRDIDYNYRVGSDDENDNWSSQPGLIRMGLFGGAAKLYSARDMYDPRAGGPRWEDESMGEDMPADWWQTPDLFVDLNVPALTPSGDPDNPEPVFPIADPNLAGRVDGFVIDESNVPYNGNLTTANPDGTKRQLPMPVRWIYVLKNGAVATAESGGAGGGVTLSSGTEVSETNPIVGRFAFWTDDETCKLNVNTSVAGGPPASRDEPGFFWDTPRADNAFERELADKQPANGEYHRYPGHPAMTTLAPVLKNLSPETYAALSPYAGWAGSTEGGTVIASDAVASKRDRLYASVDEVMFNPARQKNSGAIRNDLLEGYEFFLTAHSRSPELNSFNRPRICIWPVHAIDGDAHRTGYDRLAAFCSTLGKSGSRRAYYFVRQDPNSPTHDFSLPRNREIFEYLRQCTATAMPRIQGGGPSTRQPFVNKFGRDGTDQLLMEIFDYIRCTNLVHDMSSRPGFVPFAKQSGNGKGQVVPAYDPALDTKGLGRFPAFRGLTVVLALAAHGIVDASEQPLPGADPDLVARNRSDATAGVVGADGNGPPNWIRVQALVLPDVFIPSQGHGYVTANYRVEIEGLDGFRLDGEPLGLPDVAEVERRGGGLHDRNWGGPEGVGPFLSGRELNRSGAPHQILPFYSETSGDSQWSFVHNAAEPWEFYVTDGVVIDAGGQFDRLTSFTQEGGPITVRIKTGDGVEVQECQLYFPEADLPAPMLLKGNRDGSGAVTSYNNAGPDVQHGGPNTWWRYNGNNIVRTNSWAERRDLGVRNPASRTISIDHGWFVEMFSMSDVIRSVETRHGDHRITAGLRRAIDQETTPEDERHFAPHGDYHAPPGGGRPRQWAWSQIAGNEFLQRDSKAPGGGYGEGANYRSRFGDLVAGADYFKHANFAGEPPIRGGITAARSEGSRNRPGDWDNGIAHTIDGPYINKPDEGNFFRGTGPNEVPYFYRDWAYVIQEKHFSPNRLVPSPLMFGSLPTGIKGTLRGQWNAPRPWETLLFTPFPAAGRKWHHPNNENPADWWLADYFWMPFVEPFAISEPFSSMGKMNLNHQLWPFQRYMKRMTGLHGLMANEMIAAIPLADAKTYKSSANADRSIRHRIDIDETVKQFDREDPDYLYNHHAAILHEGRICDMKLVPEGWTLSNVHSFWNEHSLSGDNLRERPYANLYARSTTRSNVYRVHVWAQALNVGRQSADTFDSRRNAIVGEWRGSFVLERYIDPADPRLDAAFLDAMEADSTDPDYSLMPLYKYRVVSTKQFTP